VLGEADDAVQEAWLRLSRSDASAIQNLGGWLTTVVVHVCLDMLRSRTSRREEAMEMDTPAKNPSKAGVRDPEQGAEFWLNLQSLYDLRLAEEKAGKFIRALPTLRRRKVVHA
jgi:DNA-directed RNA polymerase specialized sigma24 family protein